MESHPRRPARENSVEVFVARRFADEQPHLPLDAEGAVVGVLVPDDGLVDLLMNR